MTYNPIAQGTPTIARSTGRSAQNNTGSSIAKFLPVRITATGMDLMDVSIEAEVDAFFGVTKDTVTNGSYGDIISSGQVIDTGVVYNVGDTIYVSKSGGITNIKPSVGVGGFVAGDWVIRIGVIVANESNPSLRDAIVAITFIGQL